MGRINPVHTMLRTPAPMPTPAARPSRPSAPPTHGGDAPANAHAVDASATFLRNSCGTATTAASHFQRRAEMRHRENQEQDVGRGVFLDVRARSAKRGSMTVRHHHARPRQDGPRCRGDDGTRDFVIAAPAEWKRSSRPQLGRLSRGDAPGFLLRDAGVDQGTELAALASRTWGAASAAERIRAGYTSPGTDNHPIMA